MGRMLRAAVLLLVLGLGLVVAGGAMASGRESTKRAPQRITCARLATDGPGDNRFVAVVEFRLGPRAAETPSGRRWSSAVWPILPDPRTGPPGLPVVANLTLRDEEFEQADRWRKLTGLVTRGSLPAAQREAFARDYPGVDFTDCYELAVGQRPVHTAVPILLYVFGGFFFAAGVVLTIVFVVATNRRVARSA